MAKNKIEDASRQALLANAGFPEDKIAEQQPIPILDQSDAEFIAEQEAIKEINTQDINLEPEPTTEIPFFANDDVTGQVLNARQNADLTPAQLARQQFAAEEAQEQDNCLKLVYLQSETNQ